MVNAKKLIILSCFLLAPKVASATPEWCGFDQIKGDIVEFTKSDKPARITEIREQLSNYRYFTLDRSGKEPLPKDIYQGRRAVFDFSTPIRRISESGAINSFAGIADNCMPVYAQIKESDFPDYFNRENLFYPNTFPFFTEESTLGIWFHESTTYPDLTLPNIEAGKYYVIPNMRQPLLFTDRYLREIITIPPYEEVYIEEVQRFPFMVNGYIESDVRIKATYNGTQGYISAQRAVLSDTDPLADIPSDFIPAVKDKKLMFGMHINHILQSMGLPNRTEAYDIYNTPVGHKVDYDGRVQREKIDDTIKGQVLHLTYNNIPYEIVINEEGIFRQEDQIFGSVKFKGRLNFIHWQ